MIKGFYGNCWLVDSTADVHICNNRNLMIKYQELPERIGEFILDEISPRRERIRFCLTLKDGLKRLVLNL